MRDDRVQKSRKTLFIIERFAERRELFLLHEAGLLLSRSLNSKLQNARTPKWEVTTLAPLVSLDYAAQAV